MPSNIKFSPQLQIPNWGHDQWRLLHPRILSHVGITRPHVYWYLFFFIIINMMLTWSTDCTWQGRRSRTLFYSQGCKDWSPLYNHFYPLLPHGRRSILIITFWCWPLLSKCWKISFLQSLPSPFQESNSAHRQRSHLHKVLLNYLMINCLFNYKVASVVDNWSIIDLFA